MTQYENLKDRFDELKITNKKLENEKTELNKENKLILSNLAEYSATFGIIVNIDMIHVP